MKVFKVLFLFLITFCFLSSANAWYNFGPEKTIHSNKTARQTAWPTTATTNSVDCTDFDMILLKASASSVYTASSTSLSKQGNWYVEVGYWDSALGVYLPNGNTSVPASPTLVRASAQVVNGQLSLSFPTYNYSNVTFKVWKNSSLATSAITVIAVPYNIQQKAYLR